jgi:hypothetical protein
MAACAKKCGDYIEFKAAVQYQGIVIPVLPGNRHALICLPQAAKEIPRRYTARGLFLFFTPEILPKCCRRP